MSEIAERLEILRRIGERGLRKAQDGIDRDDEHSATHASHVDLWQHLLDELKRLPTGGESSNG